MTIEDLLQEEKQQLHINTAARLVEKLQAEADETQGGNRTRMVTKILGQRYGLLKDKK